MDMTDLQEQQLKIRISADPEYQSLLQQCIALEPEYLRIRNSLSVADQSLLEDYISLCEEMEYRKMQLAIKP